MQHSIVPFADPSRTPENISIVAIGDVHGCLDKLEPILHRVERKAALDSGRRHILICVGDLIDRGPDSAGVIERLMRGVEGCRTIVLRGNHEAMLLSFLAGEPDGENWLRWGGVETLLSYGIDVTTFGGIDGNEMRLRTALRDAMPASHLGFLQSRPLSATFGDYFFVHAGVRPGVALDQQSEGDMLWIREDMFNSTWRFEKRIVHGHTPVRRPFAGVRHINIDTGACYGGPLTALLFEDEKIYLFSPSRDAFAAQD